MTMYLLTTIFLLFVNCNLANGQTDPKDNIRLSEVQLDVDKRSSYTGFNNIEIWSPDPTLQPINVTAVIFSASSMKSLHSCPCDKATFSELGYALCDCGTPVFQTIDYVGAVALYNANYANFPDGTDVSTTTGFDLIDVVLWQSSGPMLLPNPLQQDGYFAPGQSYHYPPPGKPMAYSINRCFGNSLLNAQWQAAFSLSVTATPGKPNYCTEPTVIVNEINFNKTFVELYTDPLELPLDYVALASVDQTGTIINFSTLTTLRSDSSSYFTVGRAPSDVLKLNWNLPADGQTAIVAYYNTALSVGSPAPTTFSSAIVYSNTEQTTVDALKVFGKTAYKADRTGACSLCVCNDDIQPSKPTLGETNDCSDSCQTQAR